MLDLVMKGEIVAETDISVSPPDHSMKEGARHRDDVAGEGGLARR